MALPRRHRSAPRRDLLDDRAWVHHGVRGAAAPELRALRDLHGGLVRRAVFALRPLRDQRAESSERSGGPRAGRARGRGHPVGGAGLGRDGGGHGARRLPAAPATGCQPPVLPDHRDRRVAVPVQPVPAAGRAQAPGPAVRMAADRRSRTRGLPAGDG